MVSRYLMLNEKYVVSVPEKLHPFIVKAFKGVGVRVEVRRSSKTVPASSSKYKDSYIGVIDYSVSKNELSISYFDTVRDSIQDTVSLDFFNRSVRSSDLDSGTAIAKKSLPKYLTLSEEVLERVSRFNIDKSIRVLLGLLDVPFSARMSVLHLDDVRVFFANLDNYRNKEVGLEEGTPEDGNNSLEGPVEFDEVGTPTLPELPSLSDLPSVDELPTLVEEVTESGIDELGVIPWGDGVLTVNRVKEPQGVSDSTTLAEDNAKLKSENSELKSEIEALRKEMEGLKEELSSVTSQLGNLDDLRLSNENLSKRLADANNSLEVVHNDLRLSKEKVATLEDDLYEAKSQKDTAELLLEKERNELAKEKERLYGLYGLGKLVTGVSEARLKEYNANIVSAMNGYQPNHSVNNEDAHLSRIVPHFIRLFGLNHFLHSQSKGNWSELAFIGDGIVYARFPASRSYSHHRGLFISNNSMRLALARLGNLSVLNLPDHLAGSVFEALVAIAYLQGREDVLSVLLGLLYGNCDGLDFRFSD